MLHSKSALTVCLGLFLAGGAIAQRQHVSGLVGEPPDVSTWPHPAAPDGNPFPRSTATAPELLRRDTIAVLGKVLFWEEQASTDGTMACGTCHAINAGGTDARGNALNPLGKFGTVGVIPQHLVNAATPIVEYGFVADAQGNPQFSPQIDRGITDRSAPTMIGAYMFNRLFWKMTSGPGFQNANGSGTNHVNFTDFAAGEDLAVVPIVNETEMGHEDMAWTTGALQNKLGRAMPMALCDPNPLKMPADFRNVRALGLNYNQIFDLVFGADAEPLLAAGSGVTRERFAAAIAHYMRTLIPDQAPIDTNSLTLNQQQGLVTFNQRCASCHSVSGNVQPLVGGGLQNAFDAPLSDGQFHFVRTELVKTPTLRNVGLKKHFYSDGQVTTFAGVMAFEQATFGVPAAQIPPLQDFLMNGLTDLRVAAEIFPFDRPELASERPENAFEVNEFGSPISGNFTPEIIANVPPLIPGTGAISDFRVGVGNCQPNSTAIFGLQFPPSTALTAMPATMTNPAGIATTRIDIPVGSGSVLVGLQVTGRWFVLDSGAPGGIAQSDSARWTLFQL